MELNAKMPKMNSTVKTPDGIGTVVSVSLLRGIVKAAIENNAEKTLKDYNVSEITILDKPKQTAEVEEIDELL